MYPLFSYSFKNKASVFVVIFPAAVFPNGTISDVITQSYNNAQYRNTMTVTRNLEIKLYRRQWQQDQLG
ncbi:exported protein of unknown function [Ruminococcaceae bacterium BL-4]|nr:exported protein of unknown function [Ruminococcaceae bacterium BL-4]